MKDFVDTVTMNDFITDEEWKKNRKSGIHKPSVTGTLESESSEYKIEYRVEGVNESYELCIYNFYNGKTLLRPFYRMKMVVNKKGHSEIKFYETLFNKTKEEMDSFFDLVKDCYNHAMDIFARTG